MNLVLLFLYRIFVIPIVVVALPFVAPFQKKLSKGLRLRQRPLVPLDSNEDPIWIHAASGEFEYAKSVVRELKNKYPKIPIVVTYFSPTFAPVVEKFPGVDLAAALPLDLPSPCRTFLKRIHPRLLLVARTDLWPEMMEQARLRKIPVVLFSYTQKTFRSPFKKLFTRWMFHWVEKVYCVSEADKDHLGEISIFSEVLGDTRYDQVSYRLENPKPISELLKPNLPCLVAGSTWPEDEAVLLPALHKPLTDQKMKLILVPHEPTPDHVHKIIKQLEALGLTSALFSTGRSWDNEHVLIVDKVGYLAELYLWGQLAFIGGSFRKSVHSVMEALGTGNLTFVGPLHENNREAMEFKAIPIAKFYGLEVVMSSDELRDKVEKALESDLKSYRKELKDEFQRHEGASLKLIAKIQNLVEDGRGRVT